MRQQALAAVSRGGLKGWRVSERSVQADKQPAKEAKLEAGHPKSNSPALQRAPFASESTSAPLTEGKRTEGQRRGALPANSLLTQANVVDASKRHHSRTAACIGVLC